MKKQQVVQSHSCLLRPRLSGLTAYLTTYPSFFPEITSPYTYALPDPGSAQRYQSLASPTSKPLFSLGFPVVTRGQGHPAPPPGMRDANISRSNIFISKSDLQRSVKPIDHPTSRGTVRFRTISCTDSCKFLYGSTLREAPHV